MSLFITIYQAQLYTKSLFKFTDDNYSLGLLIFVVLAIIAISHDDIVLTEVMVKFGEQGDDKVRNNPSLYTYNQNRKSELKQEVF